MVFRDNRRSCPRCGGDFRRSHAPTGHSFERCEECHGNWVDLGTLRDMFDRMKPGVGMPAMEMRHDGDPELPCPACSKPMSKQLLHRLALDRCEHHGVWFDGVELGETLFRYAMADE